MAHFHLQDEQGEIFVNCVDDLVIEGLNKGEMGPKEVVEKLATCSHLLLLSVRPRALPGQNSLSGNSVRVIGPIVGSRVPVKTKFWLCFTKS